MPAAQAGRTQAQQGQEQDQEAPAAAAAAAAAPPLAQHAKAQQMGTQHAHPPQKPPKVTHKQLKAVPQGHCTAAALHGAHSLKHYLQYLHASCWQLHVHAAQAAGAHDQTQNRGRGHVHAQSTANCDHRRHQQPAQTSKQRRGRRAGRLAAWLLPPSGAHSDRCMALSTAVQVLQAAEGPVGSWLGAHDLLHGCSHPAFHGRSFISL